MAKPKQSKTIHMAVEKIILVNNETGGTGSISVDPDVHMENVVVLNADELTFETEKDIESLAEKMFEMLNQE